MLVMSWWEGEVRARKPSTPLNLGESYLKARYGEEFHQKFQKIKKDKETQREVAKSDRT